MIITKIDLVTVDEALKSKMWRDVVVKEMEVIERNQTWEFIDAPIGIKPIRVKREVKKT